MHEWPWWGPRIGLQDVEGFEEPVAIITRKQPITYEFWQRPTFRGRQIRPYPGIERQARETEANVARFGHSSTGFARNASQLC
jgi:hypothetical protein